jgi:hypothetical protein
MKSLELHEIIFPFKEQLEKFENQKHLLIQNDGGVIVSRINSLFNINRFIHSKEEGVEHFWLVQG